MWSQDIQLVVQTERKQKPASENLLKKGRNHTYITPQQKKITQPNRVCSIHIPKPNKHSIRDDGEDTLKTE